MNVVCVFESARNQGVDFCQLFIFLLLSCSTLLSWIYFSADLLFLLLFLAAFKVFLLYVAYLCICILLHGFLFGFAPMPWSRNNNKKNVEEEERNSKQNNLILFCP